MKVGDVLTYICVLGVGTALYFVYIILQDHLDRIEEKVDKILKK
jgi:hypothetical protein